MTLSCVSRIVAGAALCLFNILGFVRATAGTLPEVAALQQRWAEVNYQLQSDAQTSAFAELVDQANGVATANPQNADAWIWAGIINSSYAGVASPLSAMKYAKVARADLEKAMEIDSLAMQGSAYTSLGTLYARVPGWPIGFGDDDMAAELLRKALEINPDGIDPNYFYADYLIGEKRYAEAHDYLIRAQKAPPRPDRVLADAGRQREILEALEKIKDKLGD